jgi:hypothetical protein
MRAVYCFFLLAVMAACTRFPDLESVVAPEVRAAPYPALVPIEPLLAGLTAEQITPEVEAGLAGRMAALQARAARLRKTVVDDTTRDRMRQGVGR